MHSMITEARETRGRIDGYGVNMQKRDRRLVIDRLVGATPTTVYELAAFMMRINRGPLYFNEDDARAALWMDQSLPEAVFLSEGRLMIAHYEYGGGDEVEQ